MPMHIRSWCFFALICLIFLVFAASLTFATENGTPRAMPLEYPPYRHFSKISMAVWIGVERDKVNPELQIELMETPEWENYVNYHHFVPLSIEGVPAGYFFNYSWDRALDKETRIKTVSLPSAEVVETGKLLFWWDRCNYFELSEEDCRSFIHTAVTHEARHFVQWRSLAIEAIRNSGGRAPASLPSTLEDLNAEAQSLFLKKWNDGPHYQCREVEVYSAQINEGEMTHVITKSRLPLLDNYYRGCKASVWSAAFAAPLKQAESIFKKLGYHSK